ncbi:phosphoglycolate phosphatase [Candidatus Vondammii sp. HM_W22]|uniref:phosphoglycolate phosphatase n=1 Tax=Candidatus Vondammii sp. HM_W22 TaxID=2687299 RepID=UPI001F1310B2|nr:phosphoglycolate phosphatase [Candidatus Vondammii sp. HM_W22]
MKKPKLILIDLDGTLVDSVPDLAFSVNSMMEQIGRATYQEAQVRNWVGNGVERLVKRALLNALDGEPAENYFEKAYPLFMTSYGQHNGERSQLYPGIREGLDQLKSAGYQLGCVTNKAEQFTIPLLKALGIHDNMGIIISGDTLPKKKPDPMQLLYAAEHFGIGSDESIMVGDSIHDVTAARAAGFQAVSVPYGYNHGQDIRDAEPDAVINSLADLPELLEQALRLAT